MIICRARLLRLYLVASMPPACATIRVLSWGPILLPRSQAHTVSSVKLTTGVDKRLPSSETTSEANIAFGIDL